LDIHCGTVIVEKLIDGILPGARAVVSDILLAWAKSESIEEMDDPQLIVLVHEGG
jgi:hypothetical protein